MRLLQNIVLVESELWFKSRHFYVINWHSINHGIWFLCLCEHTLKLWWYPVTICWSGTLGFSNWWINWSINLSCFFLTDNSSNIGWDVVNSIIVSLSLFNISGLFLSSWNNFLFLIFVVFCKHSACFLVLNYFLLFINLLLFFFSLLFFFKFLGFFFSSFSKFFLLLFDISFNLLVPLLFLSYLFLQCHLCFLLVLSGCLGFF